MNRTRVRYAGVLLAAGLTAACIVARPQAAARAVQPGRVSVTLVAGQTDAAGGFNFNGHASGESTLTVPLGWTVTVTFETPRCRRTA
jgi:Sulfocyanin (SoxE) domain